MWLFNLLFPSLSLLWYVEVRISRSVSISPLEFEITRVDCIWMYIKCVTMSENVPFDMSTQRSLYQPLRSHNLVKTFTGNILGSQGRNGSSRGQQRIWSHCADTQTDLSLRLAHMSETTYFSFTCGLNARSNCVVYLACLAAFDMFALYGIWKPVLALYR